MLPYVLIGLALALGVALVYALLNRITLSDEGSTVDPTRVADRILAETDVFRGSSGPGHPAWDGVNRLAPPTQEGGL